MTEPTPIPTLDFERTLSPDEASAWLKARRCLMSASSIRRHIRDSEQLVADGKLPNFPGRRIGHKYVIAECDLRRWLRLPDANAPVAEPEPVPPAVIAFIHQRAAS